MAIKKKAFTPRSTKTNIIYTMRDCAVIPLVTELHLTRKLFHDVILNGIKYTLYTFAQLKFHVVLVRDFVSHTHCLHSHSSFSHSQYLYHTQTISLVFSHLSLRLHLEITICQRIKFTTICNIYNVRWKRALSVRIIRFRMFRVLIPFKINLHWMWVAWIRIQNSRFRIQWVSVWPTDRHVFICLFVSILRYMYCVSLLFCCLNQILVMFC